MHYDALTLAGMTTELRATLVPGRIQQVVMVDAHSVGLEIYAQGLRRQLLLCTQPQAPRVLVVTHKLRRGLDQETQVLLLLRKYARDALLTKIEQPDAAERILHLTFEHKDVGITVLIVELIGRQSNLLLVKENGRILDCLHRAPVENTTGRALRPGQMYTPPVQSKLPALDDGRADYYERLATITTPDGKLWKSLVATVAGLSPTAARELAWRLAGDGEAPASAATVLAIAAALQALWEPVLAGDGEPGLIEENGAVVGFAAYAVHYRGEFVPAATLSEAVETYYASPQVQTNPSLADPYAGQRAGVRSLLQRARQQVQRRLAALAGDEPAPGEPAAMRTAAEWLLALSSQVVPGQTVLAVPLDDEPLHIPLDATLTPVAQAERMFGRAAKLERAARFIPVRRAQLHQDLDFLDQLDLDLGGAANQPEIAAVREDLRSAGLLSSKTTKPGGPRDGHKPGAPLRFRSAQGLEILVGRNARQNEWVTFDLAHPDDFWLHARGVPGAHVVVRTGGRQPDDDTLHSAAQLAAYHSGARDERAAAVIVTRRRWVSRPPGGKTGQVLVRQEEVLTVAAELPPTAIPLNPEEKRR